MNKFIEVTDGKQKVLVPLIDIAQIRSSKRGNAIIYLKLPYRPMLVAPYSPIIYCSETYESISQFLKSAADMESNEKDKAGT